MILKRVCDRLETVVSGITAIMIAALAAFVGWQVFARHVLKTGQFWAEELSIIAMIWIGILGASATLWTESHIGLNVVVDRLPPRLHLVARVVSDFLIAGFAVYFFLQGLQLVGRISGTWSALRISIGKTYLVVPISAALIGLFSAAKGIVRIVEYRRRSTDTPASAPKPLSTH